MSSRTNAYAQDYKDLSALKKIADAYGICIFVVHHTRKERDGGNVFNDMTGSTGIMGVADTGMILRKDDRFGDHATLSITGRDVEERVLELQQRGVQWEVTEELCAADLRKNQIPDFVFEVMEYVSEHGQFEGTISELLADIGYTDLKPNIASKYLTQYYGEALARVDISYEYYKTASARIIRLVYHGNDDDDDGNDGHSGYDNSASCGMQDDDTVSHPYSSSQSSFASWEEIEEDPNAPF